jgi:hypothetical protein
MNWNGWRYDKTAGSCEHVYEISEFSKMGVIWLATWRFASPKQLSPRSQLACMHRIWRIIQKARHVESETITGPVQRRDPSRNATDRSINYRFRGLARNSTTSGPNLYMADILVLVSFITDADEVKYAPLEITVHNTGYRADPSGCEV